MLPDDSAVRHDLVWFSDFAERGNELLKKINEVASRSEERCRVAVHTDGDFGDRPADQLETL